MAPINLRARKMDDIDHDSTDLWMQKLEAEILNLKSGEPGASMSKGRKR